MHSQYCAQRILQSIQTCHTLTGITIPVSKQPEQDMHHIIIVDDRDPLWCDITLPS